MDADKRRSRLDEVTGVIIRCAYAVSNKLGSGFVEKVYDNALVIELRRAGLSVEHSTGSKSGMIRLWLGSLLLIYWWMKV